MDITSSKAIISGGASGLGLKTAEKIINSGGMVVLMDLNTEQGNENAKN
jgi:NAD(P)-dependent dehydrogenase (short-subunit alcohol dehydrogenase family)